MVGAGQKLNLGETSLTNMEPGGVRRWQTGASDWLNGLPRMKRSDLLSLFRRRRACSGAGPGGTKPAKRPADKQKRACSVTAVVSPEAQQLQTPSGAYDLEINLAESE